MFDFDLNVKLGSGMLGDIKCRCCQSCQAQHLGDQAGAA